MTTGFQNYAARFGMNHRQLAWLVRLSNIAAKAQEREHNEPNAPDSTTKINAVESYAKSFGFETLWPGLYPVFAKNGEQLHLPD